MLDGMASTGEPWRLGHRPALDGLRGVAILLVLADHAGFLPGPAGSIGVTVFFVLSGFLISRVIIEAREDGRWSFPRFFGNRVARLAPALVLMVAAVVLWWVLLGRSAGYIGRLAAFAVTYTQNFMHSSSGMGWTPFDHTWSLATEEQFYLLWPWVVPFLLRARRPFLWLGGGVAASLAFRLALAAAGYVDTAYANLPGNAYAMLIGCGLAVTASTLPSLRSRWVVPAGLVCLLLGVGSRYVVPLSEILAPIGAAVVAGMLVWASLSGSWFLDLAPLRFCGRISYSLYLWHFPLLVVLGVQRSGFVTLPLVALAFVIATASTLWFEEPVRRWWRARSRRLVGAGNPEVVVGGPRHRGTVLDRA